MNRRTFFGAVMATPIVMAGGIPCSAQTSSGIKPEQAFFRISMTCPNGTLPGAVLRVNLVGRFSRLRVWYDTDAKPIRIGLWAGERKGGAWDGNNEFIVSHDAKQRGEVETFEHFVKLFERDSAKFCRGSPEEQQRVRTELDARRRGMPDEWLTQLPR